MLDPAFKRKLIGAWDLIFLFPRGLDVFEGTKAEALRSLIIPLLLLPLLFISAYYVPPVGMEGLSYARIFWTSLAHTIAVFAVSWAFNWQVSGLIGKQERFWLALTAANWVGLAFVPVTIALLIVDITGAVAKDTMSNVFIILTVYGFVVNACCWMTIYRINIFLTIGWMVGNFFIDREFWNLIFILQGLPPLP